MINSEEKDTLEFENLWDEKPRKAAASLNVAAQFVGELARGKEEFSQELIRGIQRKVKKGLPLDTDGEYRTGRTGITGASITPSSPERVRDHMAEYVEGVNRMLDTCGYSLNRLPNLISTMAFAHYTLVCIHPFDDGNGRTARLISDLIAKRFGLRPVLVVRSQELQKQDKEEYISSLEAVNKSGNLAHFELFLINRLLDIYSKAITEPDKGIFQKLDELKKVKKMEIKTQKKPEGFFDINKLLASALT